GNYTAVEGRDDPAFDKAAFSLKTRQISPPVRSQFGWHIIQALGPVEKTPARVQPFSQVEAQIEQNLLQQKKSQLWQEWLTKLAEDFKGKVAFQSGYAPPTTATVPGSTTPTTTG
ncbi:MAG TPA: peptidylprolyl isomerase, partial [Gaiellaceae bacterium]|nr:peptidylprolyl isomerase [Gaiellaceae bacterium]